MPRIGTPTQQSTLPTGYCGPPDDMGAGAAEDMSGTAADVATLGAYAVVPDEHPARSSTPQTATEPSTAYTGWNR